MSFLAFSVAADPRIEEECHFVYDVNNADNEIKDQNCSGGDINTYNDGNGEKAFGSATFEKRYKLEDALILGILKDMYLKGDGNTLDAFINYETLANSDCVMVTRNYNNGQYNYTEYRTRDWNTVVKRLDWDQVSQSYLLTGEVACRGGVAQ